MSQNHFNKLKSKIIYYTKDNVIYKRFTSDEYNYMFDTDSGLFARWGKDKEDDPMFSPYGPEIADIEISTSCSLGCKKCYKDNKPVGENMTFETFKKLFHNLPPTICQIAFGIGDIKANPDIWNIMQYCRINGHNPLVVPNITINGYNTDKEDYDKLSKLCGAVAVSRYPDKVDLCYNAVKELTDRGMKQINIHQILSNDTLDDCEQLIKDMKTDSRLEKLNCVVFLLMKPKGRACNCEPFSMESIDRFEKLFLECIKNETKVGFDSCSYHLIRKILEGFYRVGEINQEKMNNLLQMMEPCESFFCLSSYINVKGKYFPCSFAEGDLDYGNGKGIDVIHCKDFMKKVWNSDIGEIKRNEQILKYNRRDFRCPIYNLLPKGV